ncbi:ABC transporter substrate-binding protein [Specibacter sp. RAF43]|uniref:ABC transporter substrate-binding protein n=1 Tax=Specibacter sp. RAF43 TaxID=3233057 RepID=UPI003F95086C
MTSTASPRLLNRRTFFAATGALSALGALSACNAAVPEKASASAVLNVGQISDSVAFFPLYVAEQKGFFTAEKVTLGERPRLGTGAKVAAALKSGSIDLGAGVITDAFNLKSVQKDAVLVSSLVTEYYVDIVVGKTFNGAPAGASLDAKINALLGKKIGITGPGSGTEALLTFLFKKVGKDVQKDATLVNLGAAASAAVGALKAGRVDALSFFQPIGQMVESAGAGSIYISPQRGDIPALNGALHGVVFSYTALANKKAEQIKGFNRAIDKALTFIREDKDGTGALLQTYLKQTDAATLAALMGILPGEMAASHAIDEKAYDTGAQFHLESGLIKTAPDFAGFVYKG